MNIFEVLSRGLGSFGFLTVVDPMSNPLTGLQNKFEEERRRLNKQCRKMKANRRKNEQAAAAMEAKEILDRLEAKVIAVVRKNERELCVMRVSAKEPASLGGKERIVFDACKRIGLNPFLETHKEWVSFDDYDEYVYLGIKLE